LRDLGEPNDLGSSIDDAIDADDADTDSDNDSDNE
jgi:hypothetical protein